MLHRLHTTDGLRDYGTATWEGGDPECDHKKPAGGGHGELSPIGKGERDIEIITSQRYFNVCRKCGAVRTDNQIGLESTPEAYVDKLVAVFREVRRVLRNDGVLWLNLGDSYAASGKSRGNSGSGPSSVKQKTSPGSYFHSELNGKCPDGLKPKDLIGIPWRVAFALQADGWWLRQDIIWSKPNPMPESVTDRCTKAHEYIFLLTKSARYFYDAEAVKEPAAFRDDDRPFGARDSGEHGQSGRMYSFKRSVNEGTIPGQPKQHRIDREDKHYCGMTRNRRSVWTIATKPFKEAHFATFPPEIPEICIKAGSKMGDTILDPFSGAGTTGNVAERLGRKYIGIELNPTYSEIGEKRIDAARLPLAEQWG